MVSMGKGLILTLPPSTASILFMLYLLCLTSIMPCICHISSRVITGPLWHLWNDSTVKESKLHPLTHSHRHRTTGLNVAVGFGNGTACSARHVLLHRVSGNGSEIEIKSRQEQHFWEKMNYPTPLRSMWCEAHGAGLFGGVEQYKRVGLPEFQTWGLLFLSSHEKKTEEVLREAECKGNKPIRRSPVWPVPWKAHAWSYRPPSQGKQQWLSPCVAPVTCAPLTY